jgi:ankyrin repeat protein
MEAVLHEELREACTEGDLAAVRALILAGADVTAKHASTGVEPLDYAAFHGQWEVAQLLMRHGASPEHAVEEAQRGGFLPLAEYLRIRRARYQREAKAAADEAKRQKEGEVLARKARFQQQHNEREQRRRGELLAGQVQRAAEHNLLDEQRKEDKAARRAARQKLRKETLTRAAELAESNKDKWNKNNSRVAELNAQQKALEEEHRRAAAASRHHDFISGGGGRVPPGLSRDGLAHAPSGASSGFGSSSQLRSRLSIEALLAEEPSANLRVLEENQALRLLPPTY